ncbi:RNHCP domain-containing protein [Streptomonospora sp. S1-112]|uniref:RNHCP domain-containing protein n=1 Tax=Streptomonospora mangrovi TaxID=2883123 RepID=A0A9X3NK60_9ACTN|nr:RNHCP domain-containing protein [Streptomonospora mangrovi]MDA0564788.1 RNHCP domain-containing protein [Streptomonospora mangrovi]
MPRKRNPRGPRPQRRKPAYRTSTGADGAPHAASGAFRCLGCGLDVPLAAPGTAHRNHCPHCLTSRHVDLRIPGDRRSACKGRMEALSLTARPDGEWLVIHQCRTCGALSANRAAGDDNALALLRMALRPLADPRVPVRAMIDH